MKARKVLADIVKDNIQHIREHVSRCGMLHSQSQADISHLCHSNKGCHLIFPATQSAICARTMSCIQQQAGNGCESANLMP